MRVDHFGGKPETDPVMPVCLTRRIISPKAFCGMTECGRTKAHSLIEDQKLPACIGRPAAEDVYKRQGVCCIAVCFLAAVYLFYYGFSAILTSYIHKRKSGLYKPGRLFLLRQYTGKLGTMRFTMGTLTLLLMTAILGGSVSMMFARFQNQAIENSVPFDILVHSENPDDVFEEELEAIHDQCGTCLLYTSRCV